MQRLFLRAGMMMSFVRTAFWSMMAIFAVMTLFPVAALAQGVPGSATCEFVGNTGGSPTRVAGVVNCVADCQSRCNAASGGCFAFRCTGFVPLNGVTAPDYTDAWKDASGSCVRLALQPSATRAARTADVQRAMSANDKLGKDFTCTPNTDAAFRGQNCVSGGCAGSEYCCAGAPPEPVQAPTAECATVALGKITNASQRLSAEARLKQINPDLSTFTCQRVCGTTARITATRDSRCISNGCEGTGIYCCAGGAGIPSGQTCPATGSTGGSSGSNTFALKLPPCIDTGKCELSDILQTGVNFANFLFGLAGGLFLAIFVWAGFRYVFFAYDSGTVSKSKDMMRNAMIGLLLMMAAGLFVRFVVGAVGGTSGVSEARCEVDNPGFSCVNIGSGNAQSRQQAVGRGCLANKCPGTGDNIMCCPPNSGAPAGN